jgi:hypothetical protein
MKRLLISLCLAGAAVYTVNSLFFTQVVISTGTADDTFTPAAQTPPEPLIVQPLRSWGPYLPGQPLSEKRPPLATAQHAPRPPQQNAAYQARPIKENSGQNPERTPSALDQPDVSDDRGSASEIGGTEHKPVEWAKVMLAARVHSEASVSSPTVGYYRPGAEVQVVSRETGWLQLSDPVTQKRGWVVEKYLSSIDGPSPIQAAMETTTVNEFTEPVPAKPVLPSKKRSRPATPVLRVSEDVVVPDSRSGRRGDRRRGVGLFMFGPSAGF